jgi:preprotein translocase subunit SecA
LLLLCNCLGCLFQAIKFLQQAVGLRGYASKDPLTEFKLEGYNLFLETMAQIRRNVIYNIYVFQPQRIKPVPVEEQQQQQAAAAGSNGGRRKKVKA